MIPTRHTSQEKVYWARSVLGTHPLLTDVPLPGALTRLGCPPCQ